jgi:hypothetical protein
MNTVSENITDTTRLQLGNLWEPPGPDPQPVVVRGLGEKSPGYQLMSRFLQ